MLTIALAEEKDFKMTEAVIKEHGAQPLCLSNKEQHPCKTILLPECFLLHYNVRNHKLAGSWNCVIFSGRLRELSSFIDKTAWKLFIQRICPTPALNRLFKKHNHFCVNINCIAVSVYNKKHVNTRCYFKMKNWEEHWLVKERFVLFLLFLLVTVGYRMECATWFYAPACFLGGLLRHIGGISVLGFKYFTFLCGLVVQSDEVLLSGASALVTRLLTCWISSFQMPFGTWVHHSSRKTKIPS